MTLTYARFKKWNILRVTFFSLLSAPALSLTPREPTIIDAQHYSTVLAETRNYRIFLPPGYLEDTRKRYPVIYFFHGWSQRYFGSSDHYADYDKGDENKGDNIANFVSAHDVIVVKADGYNRSPDERYYVRPYNVGPVETHRQFPLYFPELVDHIDTNYRTVADRGHRAISGLSMGGFMTFWIGGKYPHLLSAAGNFCGSPEFVVGPKDFPVELRHMDFYDNYKGMNVRLHYGDKDFIRGYHEDMNRVWSQVMDNYSWKVYDAAHSTCGMSDMFSFLLKTFEAPPPQPLQWDHIDVYAKFSVWDYELTSDRNVPAFTILENVSKRGFRCSVREFVPDGELLPSVSLSVKTAPIYEKNVPYMVNDVDVRTMKAVQRQAWSDGQGRLTIALNGSAHEIGINKNGDKPNICIAAVEVKNMKWATHGKDFDLSIKLLNKGQSGTGGVAATLSAPKNTALIKKGRSTFGAIGVNEVKAGAASFTVSVPADSTEIVKFVLFVQDGGKNEWSESFELPIRKDVQPFKEFAIADGKTFTVAKGGNDTETIFLGMGNGDGIANPGESIVLLANDQNKYWRTDLTFSDEHVNPFGIVTRKRDYWGNYDHVGGSAKFDVALVSSSCPENHTISFFAEYWLPDYPLHAIRQGLINIVVTGKDRTPPAIEWIRVGGDNVITARVNDGAQIPSVTARIILSDDPSRVFEIELKDGGLDGDRAEADHIFSKRIPEQKFGYYRVAIEAIDSAGNKITQEAPENFVLH